MGGDVIVNHLAPIMAQRKAAERESFASADAVREHSESVGFVRRMELLDETTISALWGAKRPLRAARVRAQPM